MSQLPMFAPRAKRIIYLFQNGAPSQLDLFDYKPMLQKMQGEDLPASIRMGQRLTGMTANQAKFPLAGTAFQFNQYGQSRAWLSELLPHTSRVVDDLCMVKSMYTEAINHDPALTFFQTGAQQGNRPSMGSWLSYGLGSENKNLPAFCVLLSKGKGNGQGVYSKLWSNGFLDSIHQGVQFSSGENPVLYLTDPESIDRQDRRKMLDKLAELNDASAARPAHFSYTAKLLEARLRESLGLACRRCPAAGCCGSLPWTPCTDHRRRGRNERSRLTQPIRERVLRRTGSFPANRRIGSVPWHDSRTTAAQLSSDPGLPCPARRP